MARRRSPLKKALRAMAPHRVLWRAMSGPEVASAIRSKTRTQTVRVTAQSRQAQVQRAAKRAAKKSTAAKKTAAGKADPYAVAVAIPGQNRRAGAQIAKATQPQTAKKAVAVRKKDGSGKFDGSKSMTDRDRATWQAAMSGHVDPALLPRNSRTRRG